jgi:CubicO group peptidase (beta-lactamase class C family)
MTSAFLIAFALLPSQASAQASTGERGFAWVDTVFAEFGPATPGCAAAASREGRTLFARAYGMADMAGRPATPATVYDVASVTKQFTAMSVVLLAREGNLSLDDDVRRWIPELPGYGHKITLRHLLTHTSGIRDFMNLLAMQRGGSPRVTDADALEVIIHQRELNFAPGTDWAYSNSGYLLLAEVARRASGRPLPELARERILAPLGMSATHFSADPVRDRLALGYVRHGTGWAQANYPVFTTGDGGMYSTVEDLLRWAEGLRTGRVGGPAAVRAMETAGALSDGTPLKYAFGVELGEHRGVRTVSHGGAGGGYRAELVRFPDRGLAIAVLCNAGTAPAEALALRVADRLLGMEPLAAQAPETPPAAAPGNEFSRFAGVYVSPSGVVRTFEADSGTLRMRVPPGVVRRLVPVGGAAVRVVNTTTSYRFTQGAARRETPGEPPAVFRYVGPAGDTMAAPARYAGRYHSPDLGVTWEVSAGIDGALRVGHGGPGSPEPAAAMFRDGYMIVYGLMRFITGCEGEVVGFTVSDERVYGLRFDRVGSVHPPAVCPHR